MLSPFLSGSAARKGRPSADDIVSSRKVGSMVWKLLALLQRARLVDLGPFHWTLPVTQALPLPPTLALALALALPLPLPLVLTLTLALILISDSPNP